MPRFTPVPSLLWVTRAPALPGCHRLPPLPGEGGHPRRVDTHRYLRGGETEAGERAAAAETLSHTRVHGGRCRAVRPPLPGGLCLSFPTSDLSNGAGGCSSAPSVLVWGICYGGKWGGTLTAGEPGHLGSPPKLCWVGGGLTGGPSLTSGA